MGKTNRFDRQDADYSEPMNLRLYTDEDNTTTEPGITMNAEVLMDEPVIVEVIQGCDRVHTGDVYSLDQRGTLVECWITGPGERPGEFMALVTVKRGSVQIAARMLSLPESFVADMSLTGFQAVSEEVEPVILAG